MYQLLTPEHVQEVLRSLAAATRRDVRSDGGQGVQDWVISMREVMIPSATVVILVTIATLTCEPSVNNSGRIRNSLSFRGHIADGAVEVFLETDRRLQEVSVGLDKEASKFLAPSRRSGCFATSAWGRECGSFGSFGLRWPADGRPLSLCWIALGRAGI